MSSRTIRLRDGLLESQPEICPERALLMTASYRESEAQPLIIRRAMAFARVLERMSIYLQPGELIAGNMARRPRAAPLFPEYASTWLERELDELPTRPTDRFQVAESDKRLLLDALPYWRGKTHLDLVRSLTRQLLPEALLPFFTFENSTLNQTVCNYGRVNNGDGHIILGYDWLLSVGLRALVDRARELMSKLDLTRGEDLEKRLFYQAVIIDLEAAIAFAERFAQLAEQQAAVESNPERRAELETVVANCRRVPAYPARSFWEAAQSCWFLHLLTQIESNGHSMSLGRFDQYLYPYYRADLSAGLLDRSRALELVECFWIKCSEINKVREWNHTHYLGGCPLFQSLTIGGVKADGEDATNELSYLCLEATANTKLPQPTVTVRAHSGSPEEFLLEASRSVVRHGGGLPAFFNDEVVIPSLLRVGLPLDDARDWAVSGCAEPQVGGKFNTGGGGATQVSLLKLLEMALNGGINPGNGSRLCPVDGDLSTFRSFQEVEDALQKQIEFYVPFIPLMDNITSLAFSQLTPTPFISGILQHRLEAGKDVSLGGEPGYHLFPSFGLGATNVANALAALKKLVFEEHRLTGAELLELLRSDFAGPRGEEVRQMLLNRAPKYGNDDDYVDLLARRTLASFVRELERFRPLRGGRFGPTTQSLTVNVPLGQSVGATPDGRRAGEPLADNSSPTAGSDVNGPTAAVKSVAKLDHLLMTDGTIFNLKFHPTALEGESRLRKFVALIRTFFELKGFQVQFNILSAETLRDAQLHPQNYRNLVVKVAGYSAYFHTLDRELQDQLIARTTHRIS